MKKIIYSKYYFDKLKNWKKHLFGFSGLEKGFTLFRHLSFRNYNFANMTFRCKTSQLRNVVVAKSPSFKMSQLRNVTFAKRHSCETPQLQNFTVGCETSQLRNVIVVKLCSCKTSQLRNVPTGKWRGISKRHFWTIKKEHLKIRKHKYY